LTRWRYRYWPDHALGEILAKRWMETAIPVIVLLLVAFALSEAIPNFLSPAALADTGRQAGEIGFIVLGMALVMIVGGIDLSVGSMFALTNFCALYLMHVLKWSVAPAVVVTLLCGAVLGAVTCPCWTVSCEPVEGGLADASYHDEAWARARAQGLERAARLLARPRLLRWGGAVHDVPLQWPSLVAGLVLAAYDEVSPRPSGGSA